MGWQTGDFHPEVDAPNVEIDFAPRLPITGELQFSKLSGILTGEGVAKYEEIGGELGMSVGTVKLAAFPVMDAIAPKETSAQSVPY